MFTTDFVTTVSELVGLPVDRYPLRDLGGIIYIDRDGEVSIAVPEHADGIQIRWVTTVASFCSIGCELSEAQHHARELLLPEWSTVRDGTAVACANVLSAHAGVPLPVVHRRLDELGGSCCTEMCRGGDGSGGCIPALRPDTDPPLLLVRE